MGFVTGLLGGVTLTTSLLYLTVAIHQRNRQEQALLLRQQSLILRNITDPLPPVPEPTAREARVSVLDSAKDMWNRKVEDVVRTAQYTDWHQVREQMERGASRLWGTLGEGVREVGEAGKEKAESGVKEVSGRVEDAMKGERILEQVARQSK